MIKRVRAMQPGVQQIVDDLIDQMLYDDHDFFQETSRMLIRIETPPAERKAPP